MKVAHDHINLAKICGWFGITRQAYYQYGWRLIDQTIEAELLIKEVLKIRKNHKRMGGRKLYDKLTDFMLAHQIKMGRDIFFDLLSANNLLVKRRKRKVHTTNSFHWLRKYPNLIKGYKPTGPNQLWVSDITYWKIADHYVYVSLITDAYSHMVVGYQLAETLEAIESIKALKMAIKTLAETPKNLIHHSDRGVQYCSAEYVKILNDNTIKISMTENGDPLENAVAERINGILKDEYLIDEQVSCIRKAKQVLAKSIKLYNTDRPHMSIGNMTPEIVHLGLNTQKPKRLWKNYYKHKRNKTRQIEFSEA